MKASSLSFQAAVLFVLAGMIWGIQMAISNDHSAFPAHAHLNLLGWVSLFLFGIYYRLNPALDRSRSASIQVAIWCVGTVTLSIGVALVHTGHEAGDPIAAIGSLVVLGGMIFFGWLVYRQERSPALGNETAIAPAE
jgi:drug/metabolite transporter (DMT)-like permease